jgi:hypothetical protein
MWELKILIIAGIMAKATYGSSNLLMRVLNVFPTCSISIKSVACYRDICKVRRLGDENGQFQHNRASNM